jgi:hypothetical protein
MPLPTTKRLRDVLESQLRRKVHLAPGEPLPPTAPGLSFAVYVDAQLATMAVVVADLPAAAYLGAARGLVPVGVATGATAGAAGPTRLPPLLAEHFDTVLQGWGRLFARDDSVRLYSRALPGETPPADVLTLAAAAGHRLDVAVDVRAYGLGHLSLVRGR